MNEGRKLYKKRESPVHRTATTSYPCCLPALGGFRGSWSCTTFPRLQIYYFSLKLSKMNGRISSTLSNFHARSVPYMMIRIGFPDRVWYSAITCLQAPHGVHGVAATAWSKPPTIAIASIALPGWQRRHGRSHPQSRLQA